MLYTWITFGIVALSTILAVCFRKKIGDKAFWIILKVLAVAYFTLGIVRCFLNDSFIWVINGGTYGGVYYKDSDVLQSLLRWGLYLGYVVYPCAVFFKSRVLKNIAIYFCLPVAIVSCIFYNDFLRYFLVNSGRAFMTAEWFRHIEFMTELVIAMIIPLLLRFCIGHRFNVKDKAEWKNFVICLPLTLLVCVPVTLPQSLFGFTGLFMVPFSFYNILWVAIIFAIFISLYFAFRFKDKETRYTLCIFLSLLLFLHYNSIYLMDLKMSRLPFQLCNLGAYLVLLGLLIRNQGFFNFILLANVPGAMIAFCVPDVKEGMLSYWNIHFYIEHTWVFIIPLLAVALRIMGRPTKAGFKHFFVGFVGYFVFCAVIGIIFNCYLYVPYDPFFDKINYFYLFNTTVLSILPFLGFTRKLPVTLNGYTFYPLYMLMIFVLYSIFCMIFWYVYIQLYKVADDHFRLRAIRIDYNIERNKYKDGKVPQKIYYD